MKKFGLFLLGGIAALILFGSIGPLLGLALSLVILYFSFKQFLKTNSTALKVFWGIIGVMALMSSIGNFPAVIGLVAVYVLYVVFKNLKTDKISIKQEEYDPFTNFEKQWNELNKN